MEQVNIFWTGGFDSSYRICQLSLMPVVVQAYYISANRVSEPQELRAMAEIEDYINANEAKQCELLPLIVIHIYEYPQDQQILDAFNRLRKEEVVGIQYEWFARFAKHEGLKLELGMERNVGGVSKALFAKFGTIKESSLALEGGTGSIDYCELDASQSSGDLMTIYGHFRFGLPLFKMSKLETLEAYRALGYEEVVPMTWFCAHPVNGKPCGLCNPCESALRANMNFRIPLRSRVLYKILKKNRFGNYIFVKLRLIYYKIRGLD